MSEIIHAPGWNPLENWPEAPTRAQVCSVVVPFQGFTVHTTQYGSFPSFGPETSTLGDEDLVGMFEQIKAANGTHAEFALSWNYDERDFRYPVAGRDLSHDLVELRRRLELAIRSGLFIKLSLAGDGRSKPKSAAGLYPYNDPQGWTYGYEWLMENLSRIIAGLDSSSGRDLTEFTVFTPGYDGVFYGWGNNSGEGNVDKQPERVVNFAKLFRSILPLGHLALEHSTGHIPLGEGGSDFLPGGKMMDFDVILCEFENWPTTGDSTWQIANRLLQNYNRPPDEPAGDDTVRRPYINAPTPRGPFFVVAYEYATYSWVRGRITAEEVQRGRDYYRRLGFEIVC